TFMNQTPSVSNLGAWNTNFTSYKIGITNKADAGGGLHTALLEIGDGVGIPQTRIDSTDVSPYSIHTGFADAFQTEAIKTSFGGGEAVTALVKRGPATGTIDTFDWGTALPSFTEGAVDASMDPKRPKTTWKTDAPITGAAGGGVLLQWSEPV